ncbi:TPA: SDR family oxidoreductase [Klebsiella michiganensis]|jgi:NAD(P)-dependent dehydrogenase (short-subunit alcohol dehydrogenase family)|uniref:Dihydroanticapsin 7-dehydrogenase n=1 Tax=Klebsiella pasteurii TaxID=2587529 RepID=A0A9Q9S9N6_9ENTR|nr:MULTISPECIES: SDR family oxidoreductase [Klebsiella]EKV5145064.1 SDR family oxidoreductase [Klebsiella michiganensis]MBA4425278.1 SDR family oxidoreductase [Klebsiella michiganensis]MBW5963322.1 short-chain dehydrogenase [Klebsiella michiganensis]MDK3051966.1 SDR family oxidoreductase [Klebsiella michiganensis]MDU2428130.1 SDR family oxidoreductase [Klebsiella michiganensis]
MEDSLFSVKDKVIIVTGGLGQLGAQYVKTLHDRGAKVAALATRVDAARVNRVLGAIKDSDRLLCAEVNITDKASINRVLDSIEAKWGVPDGLVNNAGVDTQPSAPPEVSGPFEEFPEEVFREVVEVNLVGTFLMTQQVGKRMKQAGKGGSIINVGSIYGVVSPVQDIYSYKKEDTGIPFVKPVAYSAAKSGLYNFTRYCATYWGRDGIRVNTLTLSGVERSDQDPRFQKNYTNRIPIGRMAKAHEYNGAVVFLLSDASVYMTGSNVVVDGGWTAW